MMPRVIAGPVLLMLLSATGGALAFQSAPPPRLSHVELRRGRTTTQPNCVVLSLSKSDESEGEGESRLPFFARAMQKIRQKKEKSDAVEVLENTEAKKETINVDSEAAVLRALAGRTRLEGEKMDLSLTLAKIEKLEQKISKKDSNILSDIEVLLKKINAPLTKGNDISNEKVSSPGPSVSQDESSPSKNGSEENKGEKNIVQQVLDGDKPLLADDKRQDAIDGFEKLPEQIKDMMARSAGMIDGTNSSAVVDKLMEDNRLYEGEKDEQFAIRASANDFEDVDVFLENDFAVLSEFVNNLLPEVTRKEPVNMEYIDALYTEVLGKDTFNPRERKPQAIPGGYLIRGESKVKSKEGKGDGDALIEALDKKIAKSSVPAGKIQVYYIKDPTPPSGEMILADLDESPVLFITNYDISPDTQVWVKPAITFLGLASIAVFALGSFVFNEDIVNRINASEDLGSLGWLYDLSLPLAFSVLGTQLMHEFGHLIVAVKDDIKIGLPTLVPGFQFGLTGGITPLESSPKNIKSLFDFSIAGPLFGLVASVILLYTGLEMTAFMDSSGQAQLPGVPIEILRSSALGGGIIDYLLGDGVLNSPGGPSTEMIRLHPFAIAGFGGLVSNALSLLPLGNTDGGRICISFFGRSFSRVIQGAALIALVISGLFGADEVNILLCYAIYCQFWQKEAEVPCRNEVDELDSVRGLVAIGVSLIVLLTLIPLP